LCWFPRNCHHYGLFAQERFREKDGFWRMGNGSGQETMTGKSTGQETTVRQVNQQDKILHYGRKINRTGDYV
jgi:hypothetical protein